MPFEIGFGATKNENVELLIEIQIWKRKDYFIPIQSGVYIGWKATRWGGAFNSRRLSLCTTKNKYS